MWSQDPVVNITNAFIRLKADCLSVLAGDSEFRSAPLGDHLMSSVNGRRLLKLLPTLRVDSGEDDLTLRFFQTGVHMWTRDESEYTLNMLELDAFRHCARRLSPDYDAAFNSFYESCLVDPTQPRTLDNVQLQPSHQVLLATLQSVSGFRAVPSARVGINGLERRSVDGDTKSTCSSLFLVSDIFDTIRVGRILSFFRGNVMGDWRHFVFADVRSGGRSAATGGIFVTRDPHGGTLMCLPLTAVGRMLAEADHPHRLDLQCILTC